MHALLAVVRITVIFGSLVAFLAGGGCQSQQLQRVDEQKVLSLGEWSDIRIDSMPAEEFVKQRSAIVITGCQQVVVDIDRERVRLVESRGSRCAGCCAVAVAPDGYFLSAAHCVESQALCILPMGEGRQTGTPARVVQKFGKGESGGVDVVLLHAVLATSQYAIASSEVVADAPVLCVGSGIGSRFLAAGRVTGEDELHTGDVRIRIVHHSAPLFVGDSGGPVFDRDGRLVGVSVSSDFGNGRSTRCDAQLPDAQRLVQIIEADRQAHVHQAANPS